MTLLQQIIMVSAGVAATMLTRFIPFVAFRPGKPTPKYILYLGKVCQPRSLPCWWFTAFATSIPSQQIP